VATSFPSGLDSLSNPSAGSSLSSPSHAGQHADANDAIEALQAKVGVDGSAVTTSLDYKVANQGLTLVKTQTVSSGVSSVTVTDAFSSTFQNYRITITSGAASANGNIRMTIGGATTGYYATLAYLAYGSTTWGFVTDSNAAQFSAVGAAVTTGVHAAVNVYTPAVAQRTVYDSTYVGPRTGSVLGLSAGFLNDANLYTSVTFSLSTGTFSYTPVIKIYGYNDG